MSSLSNTVPGNQAATVTAYNCVQTAQKRTRARFSFSGVSIDQGTLNALVENKQAIRADGGLVVLTAKGAQ